MFPILLISNNDKNIEKYINEFIKFNKIPIYNIFRYQPDPNIIKIDQIREISSTLTRIDTKRKLIIIYDFHTAKVETQNAFLKTLEEKTVQAQFIILVNDETQVLPTIVSRCKLVRLKQAKLTDAFLKKTQSLSFIQTLPQLLFQYNNISKDKAIKICDEFLWYFRKDFKNTKILKEILKVRNLILKNNLNPQIAIDHILIYIKNTKTIFIKDSL